MGEAIKEFLTGAGSVLQIVPSTPTAVVRPDFMRVPNAQRLAADWIQVGKALQRAMNEVGKETHVHGAAK